MNSSSPFSINQYSKNPSPFESSDRFVFNPPLKNLIGTQNTIKSENYSRIIQDALSFSYDQNNLYLEENTRKTQPACNLQNLQAYSPQSQNHQPSTKSKLKAEKFESIKSDISSNVTTDISPLNVIMTAIREEISYRFLLERVILPAISPQYAAFSMARTTISTVFFTARYLQYASSKKELTKEIICRAFLSVVCSVAQEKFGLLASIFIHVGNNLAMWKYQSNQSFSDLVHKIIAIKFKDVIDASLIHGSIGILEDAASPLILTYKAASKAASVF